MSQAAKKFYLNCPLEQSHMVECTVVDNLVTDVRVPDEDVNAGTHCPKLRHVKAFVNEYCRGPNRLREPLKRVNGELRSTSWDDALDIIATRLLEIRKEFGPESVAILPYTGAFMMMYNQMAMDAWRERFGTPNMLCLMECYIPRYMCQLVTFGDVVPPDIHGKPKCIIIWACNPGNSAPPTFMVIQRLKKEMNTKVIVVDPRRTRTAEAADIHLQIRPSTDAALALGMLQVIISEGLIDREFIDKYTLGFERLVGRAMEYPLERVEEITSVPAESIRNAARTYAKWKPAAIMLGVSLDNFQGGSYAKFAIHALMSVTGNVDIEGGQVPITLQRDIMNAGEAPREGVGSYDYPIIRAKTALAAGFHAGFIRAVEEEYPYPIKALLSYGANPMIMFPNAARIKKMLEKVFHVQIDIIRTATTELADIVLPAATSYEDEGVCVANGWNFFDYSPTIQYNQKIMDPPEGCWTVWRIWVELMKRMGYVTPFETTDEMGLCFDMMLEKTGLKNLGLSLDWLKKNPTGWFPRELIGKRRQKGFRTYSGKIELCPWQLEQYGYDPLPMYRPNPQTPEGNPELAKDYPLILINSRAREYWHSRFRDVPSIRKLNPEPLIDINAVDAEKFGIVDGDVTIVENAKGAITVKANITDQVPPGIANVTVGWPEANVNILTDDENTDPITSGPNLKLCLVRVRKLD
jgi:anaerobic selenocysteine-containing dehydrogenase